jgi:pimeloyl-ACP methyl ester carboxylesterase
LEKVDETICVQDRPPVWAFNAGLLQHRSYEDELMNLSSVLQIPTLIVLGQDDKRSREEFCTQMNDDGDDGSGCEIVKIPGTTNVVPWESPDEVAQILMKYIN